MAEKQVTVDGQTHPLPEIFLLLGDREPHRIRGHVPATRRRPARPRSRCGSASAIRRRTRSFGSCASSVAAIRSTRSRRSCRSTRSVSCGAPARRFTSIPCSRSGSCNSFAAHARLSRSRWAPRCEARWRWSRSPVPGRSCTGELTSFPRTSSAFSFRCSVTGSCLPRPFWPRLVAHLARRCTRTDQGDLALEARPDRLGPTGEPGAGEQWTGRRKTPLGSETSSG